MKKFWLHLILLIVTVPFISGAYESMSGGGFNVFDWIVGGFTKFGELLSHPAFLETMSKYIIPIVGFFAAIWVIWYLSGKSRGKWVATWGFLLVVLFTWFAWGTAKHGGSAEAFIATWFEASAAVAPASGTRTGKNVIADNTPHTYHASRGDFPLNNSRRYGGNFRDESGCVIPIHEFCVNNAGPKKYEGCRPDPQRDDRPRKRVPGPPVCVGDIFVPVAIVELQSVGSDAVVTLTLIPK